MRAEKGAGQDRSDQRTVRWLCTMKRVLAANDRVLFSQEDENIFWQVIPVFFSRCAISHSVNFTKGYLYAISPNQRMEWQEDSTRARYCRGSRVFVELSELVRLFWAGGSG